MTNDDTDRTYLAGFVRRQWLVILAAVVAATAAGALWTRSTVSAPEYSASVRLRVSSNISNVQNAPSADFVTAIAASRATLLAAARRAGTGPIGRSVSSAEVDSKNRNVVVVTVDAGSADEADRIARAVGDVAVETALKPMAAFIAYESGQASSYEEYAKTIARQLAEVEHELARAAVGSAERAAYASARASLTVQFFSMQESARQAAYLAGLAKGYVTVEGSPSVVRMSGTGRIAAGALQGGVVGLLVGVAVGLVRDRLRKRVRARG